MDDLLSLSSNGPAYEKDQVRHGPPLEYIAEKLKAALELTHFHQAALEHRGLASELSGADGAFRYQVVAYLALHNMLHLAADTGLADRLLTMPREGFDTWLENVAAEGSVTGR